MDQRINVVGAIIKRPSCFLPLAMPLPAPTVVLVHIAIFGAAREADEGDPCPSLAVAHGGRDAATGVLRDQVAGTLVPTSGNFQGQDVS